MTTVKTGAKKSTTANGWNEENTAIAIRLYKDALALSVKEGENNTELANSTETLTAIRDATGAKSIQAVRAKLTVEKVYVKPEFARKVGGGTSIRKAHYVRALLAAANDKGLELDSDAFDSLESGKVSALKSLCDLVGVSVTGE